MLVTSVIRHADHSILRLHRWNDSPQAVNLKTLRNICISCMTVTMCILPFLASSNTRLFKVCATDIEVDAVGIMVGGTEVEQVSFSELVFCCQSSCHAHPSLFPRRATARLGDFTVLRLDFIPLRHLAPLATFSTIIPRQSQFY